MPFVQPLTSTDGRQGGMFNLEQAVGLNAPNQREDVRLVQTLLRILYGSRAAGLAADGWIGPVTVGWIRAFQDNCVASGNNVLRDGRLDRALGYTSSVSQTVYGIVLLNIYAHNANPAAYAAVPSTVRLDPAPRSLNPYNPAKTLNPDDEWVYMDVTSEEVFLVYGNKMVAYRLHNGHVSTPDGLRKVPGEGLWERGPDGTLRPRQQVPATGGF